ncbi:MAG: glycoside hydrolase family 57 protein [Ignavibacteriota bacterium]
MVPIKVALLWHQHQPDYRSGPRMVLPWVRLHATKDYLEMAQHLERHPKMKATINLVPILMKQLEGYQDGMEDDLLHLSKKLTSTLLDAERQSLVENCFHANFERMISRSARFTELYWMKQRGEEFDNAALRDLIVHYGLAWCGEFIKEEEPYKSLVQKDRDYTEEEKLHFFEEQEKVIDRILPLHLKLQQSGQIEISATPYYHPILPLICNTTSAKQAMPEIVLPSQTFSRTNDGYEQVRRATEIYEERFGQKPKGMWPAEGSISDEALQILAEENISWTASDEAVLQNSLSASDVGNEGYGDLEKYFPRKFSGHGKEIVIFFRDHSISDKIGFDYHTWDAKDAANDLVNDCRRIRNSIIEKFGETALEVACISIILDGENCWENFYENGKYFLDELYSLLTSTEEVDTVTFSEAVEKIGINNIRPITHITAGSWVNGNFKIWIGDPEKNRAWDLLCNAAETLHGFSNNTEESRMHYDDAYTSLLKAEGSDWMWWYGDDNSSSQKQIFDWLFRSHLIEVYVHLRLPVPEELHIAIAGKKWTNTGGAMHRAT